MVQYGLMLVFFFAFAGQAHTAMVRVQPHGPPAPSRTVKEWLNDPPKVFFFAGIEGSGTKIFQELWFNAFNDTNFVSSDDRAHRVLHFPDEWKCGKEWNSDGQHEMVARMQALEKGSIWALPYQATYPSCGAHEHLHEARMTRFHPNLEWIQEAAKEAGVKLHVIFLQRCLQESLALDCIQRNYEDCHNQSITMQQNAKELKTQIDNLDNDVVSCFKHYDEDKMLQDVSTYFTLTPKTHKTMKKLIQDRSVAKPLDARTLASVSPLNDAGSDLQQSCSTLSQFTMKDFADILGKSKGFTDAKKK